MTTDSKPCAGCPWTSRAARDRAVLTDDVKAAAVRGDWFCCHVHMGTCYGAERYGNAKRKAADPHENSLGGPRCRAVPTALQLPK